MSVFRPPCYRCELVPDERWEKAPPCRPCCPIGRFRQLGFDPEGELVASDVPGLLALLVAGDPPCELLEMLAKARPLLTAEASTSQGLFERVERALDLRAAKEEE